MTIKTEITEKVTHPEYSSEYWEQDVNALLCARLHDSEVPYDERTHNSECRQEAFRRLGCQDLPSEWLKARYQWEDLTQPEPLLDRLGNVR